MFEIGPEFLISVQTGYFSGFPEPCPEGLCQPLTQLFQDGNIVDIECVITGEPRSAEEGTFVQGGGLEIPCTYRLFGLREKKVHVRSVIKKQIRKLTA